jgi:hypothetical protein
MLAFEMRTVLNEIHLFIDTHKIIRQHFFIEQKRRGREQDSERQRERERERERENVCEAERGGKGEISLVIK